MARMSDLARYDDPLYPDETVDPRLRPRTAVEVAREQIEGPSQQDAPAPYERRRMSDLAPASEPTPRPQSRARTDASEPTSTYTPPTTTPPVVDAYKLSPAYATINAYYKKYLGRDATEQDFNAQTGNGTRVSPTNLSWAENQIKNSTEAIAYAKKQAAAVTTPTTTPTTTPPPTTPTTTPPPTTTGTTGTGGSYAYTGFDTQRAQDPTKSAKDAFLAAAKEAEATGVGDVWKTKAGAQLFAERYIRPKLEALGYKVLEIIGDKMRIVTREDAEAGNTAGSWIDFVVNADGDNPALAWQSEMTREAFGTLDPYVPTPGTAPTTTPAVTTPPTPPPVTTPPLITAPESPDGTSGPPPSADTSRARNVINPYAYEQFARPMSELTR